MKLSQEKRNNLLKVVATTVVVVVVLWLAFIRTQQARLKDRSSAISQIVEKVQAEKRKVGMADKFKQEVEVGSEKLKALEAGMVAGDKYVWILKTVGKFEETHHIKVYDYLEPVIVELKSPQIPYQAVTFILMGKAYYHHFGAFLADFENSFPHMRIQLLDLEPAAAGPAQQGDERLTFKMEILAFVKNPTEGN